MGRDDRCPVLSAVHLQPGRDTEFYHCGDPDRKCILSQNDKSGVYLAHKLDIESIFSSVSENLSGSSENPTEIRG